MKYSDFNLKINTDTISVDNINILQYLPIEDKNSIIQLALQESEENGIYNLLKVRMFFDLFIVYSYTDIEFTDEEKLDPTKLYDELRSNGLIDTILENMNESELSYLDELLEATMDMKITNRNNIASVFSTFVESLPTNASSALDIIEKFNPDNFQKVIDFATAANGGRPIN